MIKSKQPGNNNLLMKINKKIGNKKAVLIISISTALLIFLLGNYIINIMLCSLNKNWENIFAPQNIFKFQISYIVHNNIGILFYIVLIVLDIMVTSMFSYRVYTSYSDLNIGQKGTSRLTTAEEIKQQYKEVPDTDKEFDGYGGIPIARIKNKLYIDDSNTNSIVLGITRSGKGEMFVVPCIDLYSRAQEKSSMVIIDMKMELICRCYNALKNRGYDVLFLNIQDASTGIQFNPLDLIVKYYMQGKQSDAELLCNSFAYSMYSSKGGTKGGDDNSEFFLNNATSALSALIIAHIDDCNTQDMRDNSKAQIEFIKRQYAYCQLSEESQRQAEEEWNNNKPDLFTIENIKMFKYIPDSAAYEYTHENLRKVTVPSVVNTFSNLARIYINSQVTQLDVYFQERPEGDRAKAIYASVEVSGDRTKGSIFSQALTKLSIYMYENITKLTSQSTFDIESFGFGEKPVALFIGVPFYDRSKDSIVSTLIEQVFQANARRAALEPGQKCKRRIIFHLDEIGNYPAIKDFKTMISVGLGCNMIFNLFLQSYSQLDIYGDDAPIIKANCGNQIYIQTSLYETAEEFSKLLGNETITNLTRTGKKMQLSKCFTELYDERPLLNPNELMELKPGENVVKRVMKRTDLNGKKIVPTPILNSEDRGTCYLFSYEYLNKTFPTNLSLFDIDLPKVNDSCVREFFNYHYVMNKYVFKYIDNILKNGNEEAIEAITPDEMKEYEIYNKFYQFDKPLSEAVNGYSYIQFCKKNKIEGVTDKTTLGEFVCKLNQSKISIKDKINIVTLINKGA